MIQAISLEAELHVELEGDKTSLYSQNIISSKSAWPRDLAWFTSALLIIYYFVDWGRYCSPACRYVVVVYCTAKYGGMVNYDCQSSCVRVLNSNKRNFILLLFVPLFEIIAIASRKWGRHFARLRLSVYSRRAFYGKAIFVCTWFQFRNTQI